MKRRYKKVKILAYYALDEEYILFPDNPLHNKVFKDVNVEIKNEIRRILDIEFEERVIYIEGEEPIECELVDNYMTEDTLVLEICQDWG